MISIFPIDTGHNLSYCYAHGAAEQLLGTDLISCDEKVEREGMYHCLVRKAAHLSKCYDEPGLLLLWKTDTGFQRGLVVLLKDTTSMKEALDHFINKSERL